MCTGFSVVLLSLINALGAPEMESPPPLRLPNGEPICAVYFFPHWWEPWRSNDEAIVRDLKYLRGAGINTLLVDHEWSQAIDGDWKWLDRLHRLAKPLDMQILPWLSLKTWSDMASDPGRRSLARKWFGVDIAVSRSQDGKPSSPIVYDEGQVIAGAEYAAMYLDRYLETGAVARFRYGGKTRPCVALTVELAWPGGGFDARSISRFRRWLPGRYDSDIAALNRAWGTAYADFQDVDPTDAKVFDYASHAAGKAQHPRAVEDHIEFRSCMINEGLQAMKERLRVRYPDVLIATELPYQVGSEHPHAKGYRIAYAANPSASLHAEVLFLRMTGPMNQAERKALKEHVAGSGQKVVLCYRTYGDWGRPPKEGGRSLEENARVYAGEAAGCAHGIGFYSWNEMVDVHLAAPGEGSPQNRMTVDGEVAERMQKQFARIVRLYRMIVREQ